MSDNPPKLRQAHLLTPQQLVPRKTTDIPTLPCWIVWIPLIAAYICLPGWAACLCGSLIFFMGSLLGGLCSIILGILLLFRKARRKEALLMLFCTLFLLPLCAITLLAVAVR
ncbi:MAG: hypothetical protein IJN29_13765 [Akkermansia sp.]|nr:hypothetical protein [Akkermansia sp.]